ncbi:AMP-binding protein, partial [Rhodoferax sp.]|uniref:AMP-binding protein n=1 Tax=Rhodoferax sp. TaxID=50421 RepID=UPI00271B7D8E
VPSSLTLAPSRLSAWLKEQAISGWYTVPSLLAFLAYKGNLAQTVLESLRFLFFAGEVFPSPALIDLAANLPRAAMYNFFGPTETNVCCYWPVDRQRLAADQPIPIGLPAAGYELRIDDGTGELWVRGAGLAGGYWQQGRLQPFLNEDGWYPTGDRVSRVDGEYRFHGRLGRMLKCSGYRVEPAEIEAAVNAMTGVRGCAVVGVDDPATGQRPALALSLESQVTAADIRKALARQLPPYMQPNRCITLEELPRLPNGKVDYQRVRALLETQ